MYFGLNQGQNPNKNSNKRENSDKWENAACLGVLQTMIRAACDLLTEKDNCDDDLVVMPFCQSSSEESLFLTPSPCAHIVSARVSDRALVFVSERETERDREINRAVDSGLYSE